MAPPAMPGRDMQRVQGIPVVLTNDRKLETFCLAVEPTQPRAQGPTGDETGHCLEDRTLEFCVAANVVESL